MDAFGFDGLKLATVYLVDPKAWAVENIVRLEKGMATHSSILTWRIPQREEPGRLQSMELQESDSPIPSLYKRNKSHKSLLSWPITVHII